MTSFTILQRFTVTLIAILHVAHAGKIQPQDGEELIRKSRAIQPSDWYRWPGGILPYKIDPSTSVNQRIDIIRVQKTYERFTCIRFLHDRQEGSESLHDWIGMQGQGVLNYRKTPWCQATAGNIHKGQYISCCTGMTCMHETGHALGLRHEQQSPDPNRNRVIKVNYDNITAKKWYYQVGKNNMKSNGYDPSSFMHYTTSTFKRKGKGPTMQVLDRDLRVVFKTSTFYMFQEVSNAHKCGDLHCSNFQIKCENDGYLSLLDNKCSCVCPPGLDPDTGCTTVMKKDSPNLKFPDGKYAILATKDGCPDESFTTGSRTQVSKGGNWKSNLDLKGTFTTDTTELHFCIHNSPINSQNAWHIGAYCIYRKGGECPRDFFERFIQYDDEPSASNKNSVDGELPDGVFNENTRYEFCCTRGFTKYELYLPSRKPFVLFNYKGFDCQRIKGMKSSLQSYTVANSNEGIANSTYGVSEKDSKGRFTTRVCSYRPAFIDCGDVFELTPENPEVTFSSPKESDLECYWLIKAPPGDKIVMDFLSKDVPCEHQDDSFRIRNYRVGTGGKKYCGSALNRSFVTINNTLHLELKTTGDSPSGFTAKAKLLERSKMCYNADDNGESYAGLVNYTDSFKPCQPWAMTQHCWDEFDSSEKSLLLEKNYCRNPSEKTGFRPWCYTNAQNCLRDYCDVCREGKREDTRGDCQSIKNRGLCEAHLQECTETCKQFIPDPNTIPEASTIHCSTPPSVKDARLLQSPKNQYNVGATVAYRCQTKRETIHRTCLTTGEWSPEPTDCQNDPKPCPAAITADQFPGAQLVYPEQDTYDVGDNVTFRCKYQDNTKVSFCMANGKWSDIDKVCSDCPDGWTVNKQEDTCYKFISTKTSRNDAASQCLSLGAILATTKTEEQNEFVKLFSGSDNRVWIGLRRYENVWRWDDGEDKERSSYSNYYTKPKRSTDCVIQYLSGQWNPLSCGSNDKYAFVCQKNVQTECDDVWTDCRVRLDADPQLCDTNRDFVSSCQFTCESCDLVFK